MPLPFTAYMLTPSRSAHTQTVLWLSVEHRAYHKNQRVDDKQLVPLLSLGRQQVLKLK